MPRLRNPLSKLLLAGVVLCAVIVATHTLWLRALGNALVQVDEPVHADAAVVLAGDGYGYRVLRAAELVRQGYTSKAVVSGPYGMYGLYECDLAIDFAVKKGYSRDSFIRAPHDALSTFDEADVLARQLRKMGVHRYILVTSNYHTARAGRIFRSRTPEMDVRVVAAPDKYFDPDHWWTDREGRKRFLVEFQKTLASFVGM
ncbi:MAG TPA: YdcF family protein [Bryobacteraceae bacterium]|nr:YdcF family protein [Bryobacteraceae bacterium]